MGGKNLLYRANWKRLVSTWEPFGLGKNAVHFADQVRSRDADLDEVALAFGFGPQTLRVW